MAPVSFETSFLATIFEGTGIGCALWGWPRLDLMFLGTELLSP